MGDVGVLAGVAAGAALAEQVPALVELDLDLVEAGLLPLVETFAGGLAFEGVLLLDQGADAVEDLLVVHEGLTLLHLLMVGPRLVAEDRGMRRARSFLLAALVAASLSTLAAVPAGAAGPGTPRTWGGNSFGELGDGTTASHFAPGPVAGIGDAV